MFSVSASPFNSMDRSLYGGWTASPSAVAARDPVILRNFYRLNPSVAYQDSKWASMALKYSTSSADRARAKLIKAALAKKEVAKIRKDIEGWGDAWASAMKHIRSPYARKQMSPRNRQRLFNMFEAWDWDPIDDTRKATLSYMSAAPYATPIRSIAGVPAMLTTEYVPRKQFRVGREYDALGIPEADAIQFADLPAPPADYRPWQNVVLAEPAQGANA